MSRNEVYDAFEKYGILKSNGISVFSNSNEIYKFIDFFEKSPIFPFEQPDAYMKKGDDILIIEHFVVDGYDTFKNGGSKLVRSEKNIEKEFLNTPMVSGHATRTDTIVESASYEKFIDNCKERFWQHYQKIEGYKNNLINSSIANINSNFIVCFLIEDVSPLGTNTCDGDSVHPVCLAKSKEFLNFYETMPKVDWILSAVSLQYGYRPYFFSQSEISICKQNTLDYASFQFVCANPMITSFKCSLD